MKSKSTLPFGGKVRGFHARVVLLFTLLAIPFALAAQTKSVLDIRVSYKAEKTPLAKALKDIRTLTNVRFTYNSDLIRRQPPVTVDMKQVTLEALLKQVLQKSALQFAEDMGGIIIFPDEVEKLKPGQKLSLLLSGQVVSEGGEPIPGVTIRALESNLGTVTMDNGMFSLMVYEGEVLKFSGVGLSTATLRAEPKTDQLMFVKLKTSTEEMKEVVVNGYQKIDARMSTGATFKLNAADILQPGMPSVDQMLQGKVPGLMIMNNSGSVNARPTIRMRGTSTFVGNASPLWVIDGMVRPSPVGISSETLNSAVSGQFSLIGSAVAGLNPYDIESMTFLRDAAATSIYGTQGANGVIVITTKKGKPGPLQVTYATDLSFQAKPSYRRMNLMNSEERMTLSRELIEDKLLRNGFYAGFLPETSYEYLVQQLNGRQISEAEFKAAVQAGGARNTDWFDLLFQNSFGMTHSLSLSGGSDKATFYGSVSYSKNNSAAKLDGNQRITADVKMNAKVTKRLNVNMILMANYSTQESYYNGINPLNYALQTSRVTSPEEWYPWVSSGLTTGSAGMSADPIKYNIINDIANTTNTSSSRGTTINMNLTYDFGGGWRFEQMGSAMSDVSEAFRAAYEKSSQAAVHRGYNYGETYPKELMDLSYLPQGGLANFSSLNSLVWNTRSTVFFNRRLFNNRDEFNFSLGAEATSNKLTGSTTQEPGYFETRGKIFEASDRSRRQFHKLQLEDRLNNRMSIYGNAFYNYDGRYTLGFDIRSDGSNRFGQYSNQKFLPNYSVSFRWNASNEKWIPESKVLSGLNVRASYGTQGNVVTEVSPNLIARFMPAGPSGNSLTGRPDVVINSLPYPDLRWEKTYQYNIGVEMSLFEKRVNLQVDHYGRKSVDLISQRSVPVENGVDYMLVNSGSLLNSGWETVVNFVPVRSRGWTLNLTFTNSFNKNKVAEQGYQNVYTDYLNGTVSQPGVPADAFYSFVFKGLNGATGLPEFHHMDDGGKTVLPTDFLVFSGQRFPKFQGTFSTNLSYKNFMLRGSFYYSLGAHKRMNALYARNTDLNGIPRAGYNANRDLIDRWRKPGDEAWAVIPVMRDLLAGESQLLPRMEGLGSRPLMSHFKMYDLTDIRVANASFMRCRNISLNYMVPQSILKPARVNALTLGLSMNNAFTIASRKLQGQDPEIDGVGSTALPLTRQYAFNLSANF
ncbi:SusC/RagA family TonB-linked outer membrane protein [Chitinophaga sp.]|uniref:SusC/RagA family TonB-linked outer membrane protein n=1 Tax=Chitinophaga sp. TaxID=1869181 RepID=UPI00263437E6|nr:SusC/RagA family TonB-linked outer membrane protein [uncultured Chitinophaga sp.]